MMKQSADYSAYTDIIRESVSALQLGMDYGLSPGRDGRCQCIFCAGDRKDTLKLYNKDRGFYCYRCHRSGDVITLYKEITGEGFRQAVEDLNEQYALNLPLKNADREIIQKAKELAEKRRHDRAEKEQQERQMLIDLWDVSDAVQILESCKEKFAPKTPDEPWRQRFIVALKYITQLTELRDYLYDKLYPMD